MARAQGQHRRSATAWFAAIVTVWSVGAPHRALAFGPAAAATPSAMAAAEMQQSEVAAAAGNHRLAYEHALQARQLDDSVPAYLWQVARQAHAAGMLAEAAAAYEAWLSLPARDRTADADARKASAQAKAAVKAAQAGEASLAGDHAGARRLYLEAMRLDPGDARLVYAAAVEALAVGDEVAGAELLRKYLAVAAQDATERPDAERRLRAMGLAVPGRPVVAAARPVESDGIGRRDFGLWTMAGGGAAVLVGVGFLVSSSLAGDDLASARQQGKSYAEQLPFEEREAAHSAIGLGLCAVGVLAAGVGAWLAWGPTDDASTTVAWVTPDGAGLRISVRF